MSRNLAHSLVIIAAIVLSQLSHALPEDFEQEMVIISDSAQIDRKSGQVTYSGDVVLTQGTLRIESEKLTVVRNEQGIERAIAIGEPARYQQQIQPDSPVTHAQAKQIEYLAQEQNAILTGDARLEQEHNELTGERIVYNMNTEMVTAGDKPNDGQPKRIKVVIQPQTVKDNKR